MSDNYLKIVEYLEKQDIKEVVKAIFSFETQIKDETFLNYLFDKYLTSKNLSNFLDEELEIEIQNYIENLGGIENVDK